MFAVDVVLSLVVAVGVWYAASRGLAQLIFVTESRKPWMARRALWGAFEAASTIVVFLFCVGIWIGLTYLLERLGR